ncbi:MAG: hypothetical protein ABEH35_09220 [Haloarculaceae archaeon]
MSQNRKRLLTAVALACLVATAGCSGLGLGGGGPSAVDQVPSGVDTVVRVDMAIIEDDVTRRLANAGAESAPTTGETSNVSTAIAEFENETGLDPTNGDEIVSFQKRNASRSLTSSQYTGVIIHGNWKTATVVDALKNDSDVSYEETTYGGKTVYRPSEQPEFGTQSWFAVLGDGQFVAGSEQAVKDTIDVVNGDSETFGGSLRTDYENTRDGLVTFATTVPQEQIPNTSAGQVDVSQYQQVRTVTGVYYTTSSGAGVEMTMTATGTDAARDVADVTDGAVSIASGYTNNETAKNALRDITVERDGETVVVSYEDSVDSISVLLEVLYGNSATA